MPSVFPGSTISSQEAASLDEIAGKMAVVADNANGLITEVRGELQGISGDARTLLANLNTLTGKPNQQKIRAVLITSTKCLRLSGPRSIVSPIS
jgi:hypothetical protein